MLQFIIAVASLTFRVTVILLLQLSSIVANIHLRWALLVVAVISIRLTKAFVGSAPPQEVIIVPLPLTGLKAVVLVHIVWQVVVVVLRLVRVTGLPASLQIQDSFMVVTVATSNKTVAPPTTRPTGLFSSPSR